MLTQTLQRKPHPAYRPYRLQGRSVLRSDGQSAQVQSLLHQSRIQPKLRVGQPNDPYEQEADHVAEQVVSGGSKYTNVTDSHAFSSVNDPDKVQRMCEDCEEELQLKPKQTEPGGTVVGSNRSEVSQLGASERLSADRRNFFESRMGHDFDDVRIHTDERAMQSAEAIHARAYTLGRDIVFNKGQYQPGTREGDRLLAHELTHVIQQRGRLGSSIQRSCFDGNCGECGGGMRDLWVTVFFARRANRTTMQHLRTAINGTKRILRNCCINIKFDFNWTLIPNAATLDSASLHRRPAGDAKGFFDVPEPMENIGEGQLIASARGIPMLVVDEVRGTGGGTTILGGQDDQGRNFDVEYTGASMFVIAVNQPNPNGNCNHIAHEIWHITGALRHDASEGGLTACANNNVSEDYCNAVRGLV